MQDSRLSIVCVNQGNYKGRGVDYVNNLFRGIKQHVTTPHRFICFCDGDLAGYDAGIDLRPLPDGVRGWWVKLWLFQKGVLTGRIAYFDLDTLILSNIDDVLAYEGPFAMLRDFYRPAMCGSGVMLWSGDFSHIWNEWLRQAMPMTVDGDQLWIQENQPDADMLQDMFPGIVSYKRDCRFSRPDEARIVCFHGKPKPHELTGWVVEVWHGAVA